jgi:hypothetical protein
MVTITKEQDFTSFEIKGFHKVLAFKSQITIPNSHILRAYQDETQLNDWRRMRALGTSIPYIIKAGTFYDWQDGVTIFMDITNDNNAIIVELIDEKYKKLMIEVQSPEEAIQLLNKR